jgi:hypothetical protein
MTKPVPLTRIVKGVEVADPTPGQTVNLNELTALLHAAAEVERARRPIVLNGPATTGAPAAHPGIDVTIPATPPAPPIASAGPRHTCGRFTEAQALLLCAITGSAVGLLDTVLTGSRLALLVALAASAASVLSALAVAIEIRTHRAL